MNKAKRDNIRYNSCSINNLESKLKKNRKIKINTLDEQHFFNSSHSSYNIN